MKSSTKLMDLLNQLKLSALSLGFSRDDLISAIEKLLLWLNQPENNSDSNCRQIDHFVSFEIMSDKRFEELPDDIKGILFDMGSVLHDTYITPEVAEIFEGTPAQLLNRVQNLHKNSSKLDTT